MSENLPNEVRIKKYGKSRIPFNTGGSNKRAWVASNCKTKNDTPFIYKSIPPIILDAVQYKILLLIYKFYLLT